jgi:Nicotinate-nucleotide pyrophosphorylase
MLLTLTELKPTIEENVRTALNEDVGNGDITAELIPASDRAQARVISRQEAVVCGRAWVDEVFRQVDPEVQVEWLVEDGDKVERDQVLFRLQGSARSLLTGERAALNFLQTLSGTATISHEYAQRVAGTPVRLLDTQDHPRPEAGTEIRRQLRRLFQPPHWPVRCLPDQGKPHHGLWRH